MQNQPPLQRRGDDAPLLELDLRGLPAPEPMIRALAAAETLQPGQALRVLTPLLPTPLIEALQVLGLQVTTTLLAEAGASVLIRCPIDDDQTAA